MPAASWKPSPRALVERYEAALPVHPRLSRKTMFGCPAAFVNGNMVCGLFQGSVFVRLGREQAVAAMSAGGARPFAPMPGRTMKDYVMIPEPEAGDDAALAAWLRRALAHTLTLPARPS